MTSLALSLAMRPLSPAASGVAPVSAPFTSVNGPSDGPVVGAPSGSFEGWSVESATPIANDTAFDVDDQGYDAAANVVALRRRLYVRRKVRQSAPNYASLTATTYAVSGYLLSTTTLYGGAVNNSTLISPKPICNWITFDQGVLGDTISTAAEPVELTVWHYAARNGRQAPCVIFKISDGTTTISVTVASTGLSTRTTDKMYVTRYLLPETTISTLTALTSGRNRITLDAEVYPWIGGAASVAKSATDGWGRRGFSTRYFLRDTSRFANPLIAYCDPLGSDVAGVVSQTEALASATPCATIQGAIKRATALHGGTTNAIDGLLIKCNDGTYVLASTGANQTQHIGKVTVTRSAASTSRAAVIVEGGTTASIGLQLGTGGAIDAGPNEGCICFKDVTGRRNATGTQPFLAGPGAAPNLHVQWDDSSFDTNGIFTTLLGASCHWSVNGMTFLNTFHGGLGATTGGEVRMLRGVLAPSNNAGFDNYLVIGSDITTTAGSAVFSNGTIRSGSGTIVAFNKIQRLTGTGTSTWDMHQNIVGVVNSANLYIWATVTAGHSFSLSNDSTDYSNDHVVEHHNTYIAWGLSGRQNVAYDEGDLPTYTPSGTAAARHSRFWSSIGNICNPYTKGDIFNYINQFNHGGFTSGSPSNRVGNWPYKYNVERRDGFHMFAPNSEPASLGTIQNLEFVPPGSTVGTTFNNTSDGVRIAPRNTIFVDYRGVTGTLEDTSGGTAVAGSAGGDYRLAANSPAKGLVSDAVLSQTSDGVARSLTLDHAGAMSAA